MVPELAVVFLLAAALVLVPLFVAGDLWTRPRNRGRLPSPAALAAIGLGAAASLSNGLFVFRVIVRDGNGVTGLSIVVALWVTMALVAIWVALRTQRLRLYAARDTDRILPDQPASGSPVRYPPPRTASQPAAAELRLPAPDLVVYRDDPAPDRPCATPLRDTQLPPTIRDIVRAEALQARAAAPLTPTVLPSTDPARPSAGFGATPANMVTARELPPDALVLQVTRRARFPVRGIAETGRATRIEEPAFRSTRRWTFAPSA